MGWAAQQAGFVSSLLFGRLTMTAVFVAAALVIRVRARPGLGAERPARSAMKLAVFVGLLELFGTISYARGAEVGLVSIVTAASATYPLIPVLGGVILLHERPAPNQFVGVAFVIGGLMLLGLS
jgi:drug/metabolite transporter (DMT)-like permease